MTDAEALALAICAQCNDTGKIWVPVDGEVACPSCGYPALAPVSAGAMRLRIAALSEALRDHRCIVDATSGTVGECVDSGQCGCSNGLLLSSLPLDAPAPAGEVERAQDPRFASYWKGAWQGARARASALQSELAALRARLAEAEKVIEPFVREANRLDPNGPDPSIGDSCEVWQCGSVEHTQSKITYGDLRRARAFRENANG